MTTDATWRATLAEVKRQALLHIKSLESPDASGSSDGNGDWVKVEPPQPRDGDCSELWPQQQWQIAFEILFCQMSTSTKSLRPHQDDLLFFVTLDASEAAQARPGAGAGSRGSSSPLYVRRRARQLPAELQCGGARSGDVDWRASMLLNIVLQTGYCLAVATCRHADLPRLVDREGPSLPGCAAAITTPSAAAAPSGAASSTAASSAGGGSTSASNTSAGASSSGGGSMQEVCQVVYASPTRVHLSLDASRGPSHNPAPCYPDIAFAVEDFDHAFSSVVLRDPDDCYCVLLYAEARDSWCLGASPDNRGSHAAALQSAPAEPSAAASALPSADTLVGQLAGLGLRESHGALLGGAGQGSPSQGQLGAGAGAAGPSIAAAAQGVPPNQQQHGQAAARGKRHQPPPQQQAQQQQRERQAPGGAAGGIGGEDGGQGGGMPLVFSGFVSHQLLSDAMAPKLRGALLLGGGWAQKTSRVMMRGPGGLGAADVAVTSLRPPAGTKAAGEGGAAAEGGGGSLGRPQFLAKASKLARGVVEAARKAAAAGDREPGAGGPPLRLRCALMTLMVPVDMLAASILGAL